jgi:phage baseplate assembly protein W
MATLTSKNLFTGFSTQRTLSTSRTLVDLVLVNQDLLNHFNTRRNERVMMPGWGCGVWDYLFEPFDSGVEASIIEEAKKVVNFDIRVQLQNMQVTTFDNGIRINMQLLYVPWKAYGDFTVNFDKRSQSL